MTKKRVTSQPPQIRSSSLIVKKDFFKSQLEERIQLGENLYNKQIQTVPEVEKLRDEYYSWNDYNNELLKVSFDQPDNEYRGSYAQAASKIFFSGYSTNQERLDEYKDDIKKKYQNLQRLVDKLSLINSKIVETEESVKESESNYSSNTKIFIVHGQNAEKKLETFRVLKALGLDPIILHEQPNGGRTIIEKFEDNADVGYAVVLLTDDDEGKSKKDDDLKLRARQNVILELGFFIGKLGRARVCALYSGKVELPNDISGLVYTPIDSGGAWKFALAKELTSAGYEIDTKTLLSLL